MDRPDLQKLSDRRVAEQNTIIIIQNLCEQAHAANKHFYVDIISGLPIKRNVGERLFMIVSELVEAMEGHRKSLMDDHLPWRRMFEVELADALIRLLDLAGAEDLDLGGAFVEKMAYNLEREDHKPENRRAEGGKKY